MPPNPGGLVVQRRDMLYGPPETHRLLRTVGGRKVDRLGVRRRGVLRRSYRSDEIRKELFDNPDYTDPETERTYEELLDRARSALESGNDVVLDATFSAKRYRQAAEALATETDAEIAFVHVTCRDEVVEERMAARETTVSDATFETYLQQKERFDPLERDHIEIEWLLSGTELGDAIETCGLDPEVVAESVDGRGPLGELVSGAIDVDRMDYLVRDAHHTGVPYGTIDHDRLLRALRIVDGEVVFDGSDIATAESALIARTLMNATVYRHHVSRIAGVMLDRASERLLTDGVLPAEEFARLTDAELLATMTEYEPTAALSARIRERRLYKRAVWLRREAVPERFVDIDYERTRDLEADIADTAGVDPRLVIVDSPAVPTSPESRARVLVDGEPTSLGDRSALVAGLDACARELWRLGVYAPPEAIDPVREAAMAVLDLEADPSP
jgi:HD superfamily phosphohydrolase